MANGKEQSQPRDILGKLSDKDRLIDVISAFTEAQITANQQLLVIAQNTASLSDYFKDKDGFAKEMEALIDKKLESKLNKLENKLVIKFFSIVGIIATIFGAIIKFTN